ncbi:hypothetical protein A3F65_01820 [Candidatus Saccharibacteria bacterium RIFCSPHIGHO2_12_FULL_47_16b]|nr:MAG: hypothetical protein A3F65_01820 [Candidatus Saccharibacteria bacterium RIFCSPHIGHO2_12_FULL_47_16b]
MDTAAEVLLIIVSSVLAVFLIVFTIALIYIIRLMRRAEQVADSMESAASAVRKGAAVMPFIRLISAIVNRKRKGKVKNEK